MPFPTQLPAPLSEPIQDASVNPNLAVPGPLSLALWQVALCIAGATIAAALCVAIMGGGSLVFTAYFIEQDVWWLAALICFCLAMRRYQPTHFFEDLLHPILTTPARTTAVVIALCFTLTCVGTFTIQLNYNHTADELLAAFDAEIFSHGVLFAPLPPEWRDYATALLPSFRFPIDGNAAWASTYLPGNAAFRALIGAASAPQLANPLLAAAALWLTWDVARALWPDRRDAALVAVLLMATSAQVLFMAMTSWAMTGHLALNLAWIRLFLRNDRWGHAGCLTIGWLTCGWHQLAFHAFFAAPFVLSLWWQRRWKPAAIYTAAYAVIAAFWMTYGHLAAGIAGVTMGGGAPSGVINFAQRVHELVDIFSVPAVVMMLFNLLRFAAWQSPLLLALVLVAWRTRAGVPLPLQLAVAGLACTLAVVFAVLPFQGHGWGYRYVHGYIGILCLLAAHAWIQLVPAERAWQPAVWTPLAAACTFVVMLQLPIQALQIRAQIAPRAHAHAVLMTVPVDAVVVDPRGLLNTADFVRNDPFLRNRPLLLDLGELQAPQIERLCQLATRVTLFGQDNPLAEGMRITLQAAPELEALNAQRAAKVRALPCYVPMPAH